MANKLYAEATGLDHIESVSVADSCSQATGMATITCEDLGSVDIGDSITIDLGYVSDHGNVFTGFIKTIDRNVPQNTYVVTCMDEMVRAVDFFIAPPDPNAPSSWINISAEDLVGNVLALAGLTNYSGDTTNFYLGVAGSPAEVKLVTSYDYCKGLADMLAYMLYYEGGTVYFNDTKPYYNGGATSATFTDSIIISGTYRKSEKDLRNRIVCYGAGDIHAEASAAADEGALPAGFYKSVVYSHPMIDSQDSAQKTCDWNLAKLNKLTKSLGLAVIGNHSYKARRNYAVTSSYFPNSSFFSYSVSHNWSSAGYTTELDLRN